MKNMSRIDAILNHQRFRSLLRDIDFQEADRRFCRHGMEHLLSTARIMYILSLEEQIPCPKEWIYAAALLHDIGRPSREEPDHSITGAKEASVILPDCGFSPEETALICQAISEHRRANTASLLSMLLYRADKLSRTCMLCPASPDCYWPEEKKNQTIIY